MKIHLKNLLFVPIFINLTNCYAFSFHKGFMSALENDMASKVNENNIKVIQVDKDIADSLFNPKVDLSSDINISKSTDNSYYPQKDNPHVKTDQYRLSISQPIFDGYESRSEKLLQEYRLKSAVNYLKESENKLAIEYTRSYIEVIKRKELLGLSNEALKVSGEIFDKVNKKLESGYGTQLEYSEAQAKFSKYKVDYKSKEITLSERIENLMFLVQDEVNIKELKSPDFKYDLPLTLDEALKKAYEENPSFKVAMENLKVTKYEGKKTDKSFYPNVDFVGSYELNDVIYSSDEKNNQYKLGLKLNYTLYNGGKDSLKRKKSLQSLQEKHILIKKIKYEIRKNLRVAWSKYKLSEQKYESLIYYVQAKKDVLEATQKEFDLGLKTLNSLLTTHTEYIDVKRDFISTKYDLLLSKYELLSSIGVLSEFLKKDLENNLTIGYKENLANE